MKEEIHHKYNSIENCILAFFILFLVFLIFRITSLVTIWRNYSIPLGGPYHPSPVFIHPYKKTHMCLIWLSMMMLKIKRDFLPFLHLMLG